MSSFKQVSKRSLTQGGVTVNSFYASAAIPTPTGAFDNACNANGVYAGCYLTAEYADDRYLIKSETDPGITQTEADARYVQLNADSVMSADLTVNGHTVAADLTVNGHTVAADLTVNGQTVAADLTVNGTIVTSFVDASATSLNLGTHHASSVTLGSSGKPVTINGDANFKGALEFNDTSGTEGQFLIIFDSAPSWQTLNFDARYVQLNADSTMSADLTVNGDVTTSSVDASATELRLGTDKATSVIIGKSTTPIIAPYVCTEPTQLANKQYVDSVVEGGILSLNNTWTGASNTFNNTIITDIIDATSSNAVVNLFDNLTTGSINFGHYTSTVNVGVLSTNVNIASASPSGTLTIGTQEVACLCGTAQTVNINGSQINVGTSANGNIMMGGVLPSTSWIQLGEHTQAGNIELRTANVVAIGNFASVINVGVSKTAGTINIGSNTVPITSPCLCTLPSHLANKQYVDSHLSGGILPLTNVWTGASNTFNNKIIENTIEATAVDASVNLFNNVTTGTINIGSNIASYASGYGINIGVSQTNSSIIIGNNTGVAGLGELTLRTLGYLNLAKFASGIEMGTSMTTGSITIGSSTTPIIAPYVCTQPTHLANKQYVDTLTGLLSLTNVWTGASNTFNKIITNTIEATAVDASVNLFNNVTTGTLYLATGMTTGFIFIGKSTAEGGTRDMTLRAIDNMNLGNSCETVNMGMGSPNVQIANVSYSGALHLGTNPSITDTTQIVNVNGAILNLGNNVTAGLNIGTEMTTSDLFMGNDSIFTGSINLNTLGILELGPYAKTINIGTNQLLATDRINIGNSTTGSASMNISSKGTINMGLYASAIQIGNFMTGSGVGINIGNNAVLTKINGSTLTVGSNASVIDIGTSMTTGTITIGSNETATTTLNGETINVGTNSTTVNIGSAETTTVISGSITISNPINIADITYPITNPTCIGFEINHEFAFGEFDAQRSVIDTITLPHAGVYIFNSMVYYDFTGLPIYSFIVLNGQGTNDIDSVFSTINTAGSACMTQVVVATASAYTLTLMVEACVFNTRGYFKAVRIA